MFIWAKMFIWTIMFILTKGSHPNIKMSQIVEKVHNFLAPPPPRIIWTILKLGKIWNVDIFDIVASPMTLLKTRDWRGGFFSIEDEWGWVWAETTEDERVRVSPNSTKQRANMIFDCLIFLLSDVFHWWKYIPSLVVSWFAIIITVINCTGFIYTILLRKDPLMLGNHKNITFITVILSSSEL